VHPNFGYNWTKITDASYKTFVTVINMIMWATKVNTVCPVVIVNLLTNHHIYIYIYIPATALKLDTMIDKYVVHLLHVLAFFSHLQEGIQQRKIH